MDSSLFESSPQLDGSKLSDSDKRELQQFIQGETQKAKIQECTFRSTPFLKSMLVLVSQLLAFSGLLAPQHYKFSRLIFIAVIAVHNLTDICFKKCITGKITTGKLASGEESCTQNCVERYLDSNLAVLKHLEQLKGSGAV